MTAFEKDTTITMNEKVYVYKYKEYVRLAMRHAGLSHLSSDNDFLLLTTRVSQKLHLKKDISINTWKRMYGVLKTIPGYRPLGKTLETIADYLGCESWEELTLHLEETRKYVYGERLFRRGGFHHSLRMATLRPGDRITVSYAADSWVKAININKGRFRVMETRKCDLKTGDEFTAFNFVKQDIFRVINVTRNGMPLGDYTSDTNEYINKEVVIERRIAA